MILDPLAGLDDVRRHLTPPPAALTDAQKTAALAALGSASVAVRAFCRHPFTKTQKTTRLRAKGDWIVLPHRPVLSVDAVAVLVYGAPTVTTGWVWDGLDRVWIGSLGIVINLSEELSQAVQFGVTVADVTYTAGYDPLPDDVIDVVAGLAARALSVPGGGVVVQQSAGPFSYQVSPWAQGGPLALNDADKAVLIQYRRCSATVELRA